MAKSTKMGVKKLRIQSPEIRRDVKNKKAREVRAFNKEKQMKEDAKPPVVRTVQRPEKKAK